MSAELADGFDNPEMARAMVEQRKDRTEQKREEHEQAAKTSAKILDAISEETCHVRLKAYRIEMRVLSGAEEDWTEDIAEEYAEYSDEDELPPEKMSEYIDSREQLIDLLAEKSVDDQYDRAFWKQLPNSYRQEVFASLRQGGEEATHAGN